MTIHEAFKELTESESFKKVSKGAESEAIKQRVYLSRYKKGTLKTGAMVDILIVNDYEVSAKRVKKKKQ
ncbi:MAG: hypothetical protein H7178_10980 [Chitinophagaceae bacterium]|nr:hypothetical protein [Chitinophagaceae bacterium]